MLPSGARAHLLEHPNGVHSASLLHTGTSPVDGHVKPDPSQITAVAITADGTRQHHAPGQSSGPSHVMYPASHLVALPMPAATQLIVVSRLPAADET